MSAAQVVLGVAALLIGLTGAWSPCGFSMVETIGVAGREGTRRVTAAACATFSVGAVAGGVATFGALALLGDLLHGAGGRFAYLVAAAIALTAAVAEARGLRIAPQIRRQLPQAWRWTMPLPVAAALYGVLLGLGFTTFVLTFGVWALAGMSLALGDPGTGLILGAAFGVGRALPVVIVAPAADRPFGIRCVETMAERPSLYRGFRLGDAATLTAAAVALTVTATASATQTEVSNGADPSAAAKALAFQHGDRSGYLRAHGVRRALPGHDPAIGGPYVAVIGTGQIHILDRTSLEEVGTVAATGAQNLAVSQGWLAYVTLNDGRFALKVRRIANPANPGDARVIDRVGRPAQIGHPSLDGGLLMYAIARDSSNSLVRRNIRSGFTRKVMKSKTAALENPSVLGDHFIYVRMERKRQSPQATGAPPLLQRLLIARFGGGAGHTLYARTGGGQIWTTSLARRRAYFTLMKGGRDRILSVPR
jgi:hypothetical protein